MSSSLGNKHICSACGTKYYDFQKPDWTCPRCGLSQDEPESSPSAPGDADTLDRATAEDGTLPDSDDNLEGDDIDEGEDDGDYLDGD